MQIEFFTALTSVGIEGDLAKTVIASLERTLLMPINQAVQPVIQRMDSLEAVISAKLDALVTVRSREDLERERRLQLIRWTVGTGVGAIGSTLGVLKLFGWV